MLFMRVLGGLVAAVVVGLILGAVKDYLHLWEANYQYVWPLAMGIASFAGALVMAMVKPSRLAPGGSAKPAMQAAKAGKAAAIPAGSADVPGMPSFDFDKARATASAVDSAKGSAADSRPADKAGGQ